MIFKHSKFINVSLQKLRVFHLISLIFESIVSGLHKYLTLQWFISDFSVWCCQLKHNLVLVQTQQTFSSIEFRAPHLPHPHFILELTLPSSGSVEERDSRRQQASCCVRESSSKKRLLLRQSRQLNLTSSGFSSFPCSWRK